MASEQLEHLRADYAALEGKPFKHFYCPLLCVDEPAELCEGHIVNQAILDSSRKTVLQRADVDGFYGTHFEAEFVTMCNCREVTLPDVIGSAEISKKLKPQIMVGEESIPYYRDQGKAIPPHHTSLTIENEGGVVKLVLKQDAATVEKWINSQWSIMYEADMRLSTVVCVIKSAYLTLFRLIGYGYGLSTAGYAVGHYMLGRFFRESQGKDRSEIRDAAKAFFLPYINMVRPIDNYSCEPPLGTIEDYGMHVCFGSSGRPFALAVCVRSNKDLHTVLMPAFNNHESVGTYLDFLRNDNESLRLNPAYFNSATRGLDVDPRPLQMRWPKKGDTFRFD